MNIHKDPLYVILLLALFLLLPYSIYSALNEQKQWNKFVLDHHCKITVKMNGSVGIGVSTNGQAIVISNPDKTGYLCDDGIN